MHEPIMLVILAIFALSLVAVFLPPISKRESMVVSVTGLQADVSHVQAVLLIGNVFVWAGLLLLHNMQLQKQSALITAYDDKRCSVLDGTISGFQTVVDKTHGSYEAFLIGDKRFICFHSPFLKAGFSGADLQRSGLKDGQKLRIWYWKDAIARVDLASGNKSPEKAVIEQN